MPKEAQNKATGPPDVEEVLREAATALSGTEGVPRAITLEFAGPYSVAVRVLYDGTDEFDSAILSFPPSPDSGATPTPSGGTSRSRA